MSEGATKGTELLLGNPKKAMIGMMVPVIVALTFQSLNSVINSVWVTGLGPDALAAVGIVFPLFIIILSVGNGIGIGASQTVAMYIGMEDKKGADRAAAQALVLTIIGGIVMAVVLTIFLKPILILMGGESIIDVCYSYAFPIVLFAPVMMFSALFSNLLRAEGAAKKSMAIQIFAAVVNLIIDPFLIYKPFGFGLGLGISGAAYGTVIAMLASMCMGLYWFKKKDGTYLTLSLRGFKFDTLICRQIFKVGIPASLEMMIVSLVSIVMNNILLWAGGSDAVAIYANSWRIINILMIPLMSTGSAMIPVCAAAFGAKRFDRVQETYRFTLKLVVTIMIIISIFTLFTAKYMVAIISYTPETVHLRGPMSHVMYAACLFLPFASWGSTASALFQSLTLGTYSLICTLIRNLMQLPLCIYLFNFGGTLDYIWMGIAAGQILGSLVAGIWGEFVLRHFVKKADAYHPRKGSVG
ncbi:MAG: MATE family efflux transporter [Candidatus Methanomethylophilaceae archaeon]|jgi:putative MATE family efflux protein